MTVFDKNVYVDQAGISLLELQLRILTHIGGVSRLPP